jgi:hypothetical protein
MTAGAPATILDHEVNMRMKTNGEVTRQKKPGTLTLCNHCVNPGLPSARLKKLHSLLF